MLSLIYFVNKPHATGDRVVNTHMSLTSKRKASSEELFRHSFDMMMLLKSKAISVEEAKAQSNLLKQANNILRYELDRAIAEKKFENLNIREIEG
jgi:hypothetical protein